METWMGAACLRLSRLGGKGSAVEGGTAALAGDCTGFAKRGSCPSCAEIAAVVQRLARPERVTSCRWRKQIEITRQGPDISQALEKQTHWRLH
jgi:hypothetical protein